PADPAALDLPERDRVQVVQLGPAAADRGDEVGRRQDVQVLGRRLAGHAERAAQLGQRLAVLLAQAGPPRPPGRIGQRPEHRVVVWVAGHSSQYAGNYLPKSRAAEKCQWAG